MALAGGSGLSAGLRAGDSALDRVRLRHTVSRFLRNVLERSARAVEDQLLAPRPKVLAKESRPACRDILVDLLEQLVRVLDDSPRVCLSKIGKCHPCSVGELAAHAFSELVAFFQRTRGLLSNENTRPETATDILVLLVLLFHVSRARATVPMDCFGFIFIPMEVRWFSTDSYLWIPTTSYRFEG